MSRLTKHFSRKIKLSVVSLAYPPAQLLKLSSNIVSRLGPVDGVKAEIASWGHFLKTVFKVIFIG